MGGQRVQPMLHRPYPVKGSGQAPNPCLPACTCRRLTRALHGVAEVAFKRGLEELVWRSEGIDGYIRDALELVRDLDAVLVTIKDNVTRITELLRTFERSLMFERKVRVARAWLWQHAC